VGLAPIVDLTDAASADGVLAPEAGRLLAAGAPSLVEPGGVNTILVHGDDDAIVPVRHSVELARVSGAELHRSGAGHFDLLDPSKPEWAWVVERLP
jgi:pimeloyl-ACP methyl ester carboxylesterase